MATNCVIGEVVGSLRAEIDQGRHIYLESEGCHSRECDFGILRAYDRGYFHAKRTSHFFTAGETPVWLARGFPHAYSPPGNIPSLSGYAGGS